MTQGTALCRDIKSLPTRDEVFCSIRPWLPRNAPDAPHHLQGAERLLDTHFRLLRNDCLQTFFENARQIVKDSAEGTHLKLV